MKKTICALAAVLMMGTVSTIAFAENFTETYEENGITITFPEELNPEKLAGGFYGECNGTMAGVGEMDFYYVGLPKEETSSSLNEGEAEAEAEMSPALEAPVLTVFSFDGGRTPGQALADLGADPDIDLPDLVEVGKAGDITFYAYSDPYEAEQFLAAADQIYADEFQALQRGLMEALKNARYSEPVDPGKEMVGKKVSFETTDIDGNPVKSSELFREHKLTMVNIWETNCSACLNELAGLNDVNKRVAGKDAAVITICLDADTNGDLCKELLQENGAEYPILLPFDGIDEMLPITGFPTSFFVDSEGTIAVPPFGGVPISMDYYVNTIEEALNGEKAEITETASPVSANEEGTYRVFVKDANGNPVKDTVVQFCSDSSCMLGTTDESGMASFNTPKGIYAVHILKAPEGYEQPEDEYKTQENFCDVSIVMQQL